MGSTLGDHPTCPSRPWRNASAPWSMWCWPIRRSQALRSTIGVSSGWSSINRGNLTVSLKPLSEAGQLSSDAMIDRLRGPLESVGGVQTTLFAAQDLRGGGRQGGAQFQYADDHPRRAPNCGNGRWRSRTG